MKVNGDPRTVSTSDFIQVAAIPWPSTWPSSARELGPKFYEQPFLPLVSSRFLAYISYTFLVRSTIRRRGVILVARGPRCTDRSSAACSTKGATFRASTAHNATRTAALSLPLLLSLSLSHTQPYPSPNECQERYSVAFAKSGWRCGERHGYFDYTSFSERRFMNVLLRTFLYFHI